VSDLICGTTGVWILIGLAAAIFAAVVGFAYCLCRMSYDADSRMGQQEWQVPDEERMKGYRKGKDGG
jgi:hypothetical protein